MSVVAEDFDAALAPLAVAGAAGALRLAAPRLRFHDSVASTNSLAMDELRAGRARPGDVHVALEQTAGRGTQGRGFSSPRGAGLWCSLVADDRAPHPLPFWPAVAVCDLARDRGVDAHLKWPNDVLVGGRKLAGVLVETATEAGRPPLYVVGVGLNVHPAGRPAELAGTAISLAEAGARDLALPHLLAELLQRMDALAGDDLVAAWRARTRLIGREVDLAAARAGRVRIVDVDGGGGLVVEDAAGRRRVLVSQGEVAIDPGALAQPSGDLDA